MSIRHLDEWPLDIRHLADRPTIVCRAGEMWTPVRNVDRSTRAHTNICSHKGRHAGVRRLLSLRAASPAAGQGAQPGGRHGGTQRAREGGPPACGHRVAVARAGDAGRDRGVERRRPGRPGAHRRRAAAARRHGRPRSGARVEHCLGRAGRAPARPTGARRLHRRGDRQTLAAVRSLPAQGRVRRPLRADREHARGGEGAGSRATGCGSARSAATV